VAIKGAPVVTPWEVKGEIDYDRLMERFGTEPITPELLERIRQHTGGPHYMLRRGVFYSHRDLDAILDHHERGGRFVLYTGRGPAGPVHLGHLVPWTFTRHLQEAFGSKLFFQFTDDERMLIRDDVDEEFAGHWVLENALDVMALGFDPENTEFIVNTRHASELYPLALKIARGITCSTMRAVFGFGDDANLGKMFFPTMQAAPCFLASERAGKPVPCLVPAGIDQDPYWRVTRDVARKLGYPKPAQVHGRMLPGLTGDAKMSSSQPITAIYTTDVPELVERKIAEADTGEHPDRCPMYQYRYLLLTEDDDETHELYEDCIGGGIDCQECKSRLTETVNRFMGQHRRRRRLIRGGVEKMLE
jgi:tryptophanyl-tRNA synthetase